MDSMTGISCLMFYHWGAKLQCVLIIRLLSENWTSTLAFTNKYKDSGITGIPKRAEIFEWLGISESNFPAFILRRPQSLLISVLPISKRMQYSLNYSNMLSGWYIHSNVCHGNKFATSGKIWCCRSHFCPQFSTNE